MIKVNTLIFVMYPVVQEVVKGRGPDQGIKSQAAGDHRHFRFHAVSNFFRLNI